MPRLSEKPLTIIKPPLLQAKTKGKKKTNEKKKLFQKIGKCHQI